MFKNLGNRKRPNSRDKRADTITTEEHVQTSTVAQKSQIPNNWFKQGSDCSILGRCKDRQQVQGTCSYTVNCSIKLIEIKLKRSCECT